MTDKKQTGLNPDDHGPISLEKLEDAVKKVLFAPIYKKDKAKYKNRKPTKEELNQKWKLEKDPSGNWKRQDK